MAAVVSPLTHAQFDGGAIQFRQAFALLPGAILLRLQERMSVRDAGALLYVGDLGGSGSDTMRTRYYDSIGWAAAFSSTTETGAPARSDIAAEIEDVTIGRYYLGYSQTYMDVVLGSKGEITLWDLAGMMVEAWEATWMTLVATTVMSAAADYGTPGANMTFDNYLDMIGYYRTLDGFEGSLFGLLHGKQIGDLADSMRAEPSYQFPTAQPEIAKLRGSGFNFELLGASVYKSGRVISNGGNRHGAFFGRGAMGWAIAGTQKLAAMIEDGDKAILVPQLGLAVERSSSGNGALGYVDGNVFLGMDIQDDSQLRGMVTGA